MSKMEVTPFISPLQTVQVLSIFNYLNTLSDFLYTKNFLDKDDQHKRIPIVNALYEYLNEKTNENIQHKKYHLAKKLINGTDLYGAKENETPNAYFIDSLFDHIITTVVFDRFINVFGFIALVVYATERDSIIPLKHRLRKTLVGLTYENEYGNNSQLSPFAIDSIFADYVNPLLPEPEKLPVHVTSVDYLYAMAGNMFLRSKTETEGPKVEVEYQDYIEIAHGVEQLVLAKKLNESALRIFAFPAIIHYVYKERAKLNEMNINEIISSPEHWREAYRSLFSYLNDAFTSMENVQKSNYPYQFYLSLSTYKNRTTLARETIEINCASLTDSEMEEEILKYKNNPDDYKCRFQNEKLGDLNKHYQEMVEEVSGKYETFEKESCRVAFGEKFIKEMDATNVVISKGFIRYFYYGGLGSVEPPVQMANESHDVLQFYFPNTEETVYYALIRKGYNVTLIKETDNPELFRTTLGLFSSETFRSNNFPDVLKSENEKFDTLLKNIATKRKERFQKSLEKGYDQTWREWWKDFGLSLIPFYTCVKDIKNKNIDEATLLCPLDALLVFPILSEMRIIAKEAVTIASKSMLSLTETTLRTITIRTSMRTMLRITGRALIDEITEFGVLFSKENFQNLGIALLRYIDPGFELVFTIGQGGLTCLHALIIQSERRFAIAYQGLKSTLFKGQYALSHYSTKVDEIFGKNVYVHSLFSTNSGYGHKFVPLKNGKFAELRKVYPSGEEVSLVARDNRIYDKIDLESERLIGDDFFVEDEGVIVSDEKHFVTHIISNEVDVSVEGGNLATTLIQTLKTKNKNLKEVVDFAIMKKRLPEMEIRKELKKYNFPTVERTDINFVREWMNNPQLKIPNWAEKYRVDEPDIFFELKYKERMDIPNMEIEDAKKKINALYPIQQHPEIIKELPVGDLLEDFNQRKAFESVRFEDYYALRWYGGSGYRKMAENSHEARRMKNAIYKLAIRQSEDPNERYAEKLFRGEGREPEAIEKEISSMTGEFQFTRFTSTSTDVNTAITYSLKSHHEQTRVMYVMTFKKPIVRARVEHLFVLTEKETILLPGTKFHIDEIERYKEVLENGKEQNCIRIKMSHMDEATSKESRQMNIMQEIKKLRETGTVYYPEELV